MTTPCFDPPSNELKPSTAGLLAHGRLPIRLPNPIKGQWLRWIANGRLQLRGQPRNWEVVPYRIPVSPSWEGTDDKENEAQRDRPRNGPGSKSLGWDFGVRKF